MYNFFLFFFFFFFFQLKVGGFRLIWGGFEQCLTGFNMVFRIGWVGVGFFENCEIVNRESEFRIFDSKISKSRKSFADFVKMCKMCFPTLRKMQFRNVDFCRLCENAKMPENRDRGRQNTKK